MLGRNPCRSCGRLRALRSRACRVLSAALGIFFGYLADLPIITNYDISAVVVLCGNITRAPIILTNRPPEFYVAGQALLPTTCSPS
jgi:hypothetical protein